MYHPKVSFGPMLKTTALLTDIFSPKLPMAKAISSAIVRLESLMKLNLLSWSLDSICCLNENNF